MWLGSLEIWGIRMGKVALPIKNKLNNPTTPGGHYAGVIFYCPYLPRRDLGNYLFVGPADINTRTN